MTCDEFEAMLYALAAGWSTRDYKAVADHFAEKCFYTDPLNYAFHNRAEILEFFRADDGREQYCEFHAHVFDEDRQLGVAEYTYEGTYRYHGTVWIEIVDGKISSWREYQHRSNRAWSEFWDRKIDE